MFAQFNRSGGEGSTFLLPWGWQGEELEARDLSVSFRITVNHLQVSMGVPKATCSADYVIGSSHCMGIGGTLGSKELNCHLQWNKWFNHKFLLYSPTNVLPWVHAFPPFQILLSFMISYLKMAPLSFRSKVSLVHHQKWS